MMFKQSLFFFFISSSSFAAQPPAFPVCIKPANFATPGALTKYEACQKNQIKHCDRFEKDPKCKEFYKNYNYRPEDKKVTEGCGIIANGQYRCQEAPLRFVEKEKVPQPVLPKQEDKDVVHSTQTEADGAATLAIPPPPPAKPITTPAETK